MRPDALLDSNVIIAAVAEAHEHHSPSLALFTEQEPARWAVTAHSYAEAYATLTRRGDHSPFRFPCDEAWAALERVAVVTTLVGLSPAQSFDTVRSYAHDGGVGARLYDRLIGEAAVLNGLPTLVTWNARHMTGLFPQLLVVTPAEIRA